MTAGPYGDDPYPGHHATQPGYQAPQPDYPSVDPYGQGGYPTTPGAATGHMAPGYAAPYPAPGVSGTPNPAYPPPGYPAVPMGYATGPRNGLGTAAMVLGIIGIVFCWIPFTGWALNILAVIFGGVGMGRAKRGEATNGGSALTGLILGAIGLAVWVVIVIVMVAAVNSVSGYSL